MRVLLASSIFPETIEELQRRFDLVEAIGAEQKVLKERIRDCEAVIFRSGVVISADVMAASPRLQLVVRAGSGFDNVDLEYVRKHRLQFFRIPGPSARAVAEMAFALMLALSRNVLEADRSLRQGRWCKQELSGYLLHGKTLGIVGAGNIGSTVGRLGAAWGMQVIGCVKRQSPQRAAEMLASHGIRLTSFDEVVRTADIVSIHVPLDTSTRRMFDRRVLSRMKPGALLMNFARGGVVDERDLHAVLVRGDTVRGAALDVHEQEGDGLVSPLAALPNVVLTPHIGAQTIDSQRQIGLKILNILETHAGTRVPGSQSVSA